MSSQSAEHALYYNGHRIAALQLRWGDGFLSPGGGAELARMFEGVDLAGKTGLDLGCGVGGFDVLLARSHGVSKIVGIDLSEAVISDARARAEREGLGKRLTFQAVEPGSLPFADESFDFAFAKDAIADVPHADKPYVVAELHRVCRPGGRLVISDWFRAEEPYTDEMRAWAGEGDGTCEMQSLSRTATYVREARFARIELDDRNDWFRRFAAEEYEHLKGPLFAEYVARFGEESARSSVENSRVRALLAEQGQLRPGHIRATKPHR